MTIEERAQKIIDDLFNRPGAGMKHYNKDSFNRVLIPMIAAALREQIEECAKIAETGLDWRRRFKDEKREGSVEWEVELEAVIVQSRIVEDIRALATPENPPALPSGVTVA